MRVFRSRRVAVLAFLGFASGMPLFLTGQTLVAWMLTEDIDLKAIGAMSLVGAPYAFKWAWAPVFDRYAPRIGTLGPRRAWMLVFQVALAAAIAWLGSVDAAASPWLLAAAALTVATLSASHDVVIDAYNTEVLREEERAAGMATFVMGYRTAMLLTGTLALVLGDWVPWPLIYGACAALMLVGVAATLVAEEPPAAAAAARPRSIVAAVWRPVRGLLARRRIAVVLAFVALYRLGDAFALSMIIPFLSKGAGFSFTEIATTYKLLGFAGTVAGGFVAGAVVGRLGLGRALFAFGALQAATNLLYMWLASERTLGVLAVAVLTDNFAGAMGSGAFIAYLMSLCDPGASATQFALLSSLSTVGARLFGYAAASLVVAYDWTWFWAGTALLFVPAALLIAALPLAGAPLASGRVKPRGEDPCPPASS